MALSGTVTVATQLRYTPATPPDLSSPSDNLNLNLLAALTTGVGLNQADRLWHDQRLLAASTNDDLDLSGALVDVWGETLTFARIKGLIIAHVVGTNNLTIGGAPANPWITWLAASGDGVVLRPGGIFAAIAPDATGYAVTAGTGDILRIANGAGTSVTYEIALIGADT